MMKLGTETGSLVNHFMADGRIVPQVGIAATILMWSDRRACTVIEVSKSGKSVKVQLDKSVRTDKNGMSEEQTYDYERNPNGIIESFRLTKRGWRNTAGNGISFGFRREFFDFSF